MIRKFLAVTLTAMVSLSLAGADVLVQPNLSKVKGSLSRRINWRSKTAPATPGAWYAVEVDVNTADAAGGLSSVRVRQVRKDGKSICYSDIKNVKSGSAGFVTVKGAFQTRDDCAEIQLYCVLVKVEGAVLVKNLKIYEISADEAQKIGVSQVAGAKTPKKAPKKVVREVEAAPLGSGEVISVAKGARRCDAAKRHNWRSPEGSAKADSWYEFSAEINTSKLSGSGLVSLRVRQIREDGKSICYSNIKNLKPGSDGFVKVEGAFKTGSAAARLQIYCVVADLDGEVLLKNVKVSETSEAEAKKKTIATDNVGAAPKLTIPYSVSDTKVMTGQINNRYVNWRSPELAAKPNTWYRASADIKMSVKDTPGQIRFRVRQVAENGKSIRYANIAVLKPITLDFENHSNIFMTTANCKSLQVYYILDRIDGEVSFRNLRLEEIPREEAEKIIAANRVEPVFFSSPVYAYTGEKTLDWGYRIAKLFIDPAKMSAKITFDIPELNIHAEDTAVATDKHVCHKIRLDSPLAKGKYNISMKAFDADNKEVMSQNFVLKVIDRPDYAKRLPVKSISIDAEGNTLINGKKTLMHGLYHVYSPQEAVDINYAGFNAIIAWAPTPAKYKNMLDFAADNDLYSDCVLKFISGKKLDDLMAEIKDHPSVVSWDIVDEPAIRNIKPHRLMPCVNQLRAYNTGKPLRISFSDPTAPPDYRECYDIAAVHKYPIPFGGGIKAFDNFTRLVNSYFPVPRKNSPHFTLQIWISGHDNTRRPITADQIRSQAYIALINGIKGLWWYSFREKGSWDIRTVPGMWSAFKGLNAELFKLEKYIFGKRTIINTGNPDVIAAKFEIDDRGIVIVTNLSKTAQKAVLPGITGVKGLFDADDAEKADGLVRVELPGEKTKIFEIK